MNDAPPGAPSVGVDRPGCAGADRSPAGEVLALLDEVERLYARLEAIGQEAARCEDAGEVLDCLRRRQGFVDELGRRDACLVELRARLGRTALPPEERGAIDRRLGLIAEAARRLAGADTDLRARLLKRREALAGELAAVGRGLGAHAAYGARGAARGPRMQDREG